MTKQCWDVPERGVITKLLKASRLRLANLYSQSQVTNLSSRSNLWLCRGMDSNHINSYS